MGVVVAAPRDGAPALVRVRRVWDADVFLAAAVDAQRRIVEWLELWVQRTDALAGSTTLAAAAATNARLDAAWDARFEALLKAEPESMVVTGWEGAGENPLFVDAAAGRVVAAVAPSGVPWKLCTDEGVLSKQKVGAYGSTLERFVYAPGDEDSGVVACGGDDAAVRLGLMETALALNPGAGRMMVRRLSHWTLEQFADMLTGVEPGSGVISTVTGSAGGAMGVRAGDWLLPSAAGKLGRLLETVHLKLALVRAAVATVRGYADAAQVPMLNITAESFAVASCGVSAGLPAMWATRVGVGHPGDAYAIGVGTTGEAYFVRAGVETSAYQPRAGLTPLRGTGSVRLRKVQREQDGSVRVEGTLTTAELSRTRASDLLEMLLDLPEGRVIVWAHPDMESALAQGEVRFRSVPMNKSEAEYRLLREAEGGVKATASFQCMPLVSSPADLYALAVLAMRVLLTPPERGLAEVIDEVMSLGRATSEATGATLAERVRGVMLQDPERWLGLLGPQVAMHPAAGVEEALSAVPLTLWSGVLAALIRMVPGLTAESFCSHLGDAHAGALHKTFDGALAELDALLVRSRSLLVTDWTKNREMNAVVQGMMSGTSAAVL